MTPLSLSYGNKRIYVNVQSHIMLDKKSGMSVASREHFKGHERPSVTLPGRGSFIFLLLSTGERRAREEGERDRGKEGRQEREKEL